MGAKNMKPVTAIVIGAGQRGENYAAYAKDCPHNLKIIGVAEPRPFYRERLQNTYSIPATNVFTTWQDVAALDKFADCVIIATPDRLHKEPALAFAKKGYHILLEKPMAVTYADCCEIVEACEQNSVCLAVCHVLRYSPEAIKIRELIHSGAIGEVVNIQLLEPVGHWHFAHSYVRGNWRNEETSSSSLLAKSCHDIDLIAYWMGATKCTAISSFGSLNHFRKDKKPAGASSRCLDCSVEKTCPYSAKRIYLDAVKTGHTRWPVSVITEVPDIESVTEALRSGPYGRCVYDCDNDVMDNQVVNMQFEGGATVSFSMVAFTEKICARQVKVHGTKGELTCSMGSMQIIFHDFAHEDCDVVKVQDSAEQKGSQLHGHGGADFYNVHSFIQAVQTGDKSKILTGPRETLRSHQLVFVAEKSRKEMSVITNPEDVTQF